MMITMRNSLKIMGLISSQVDFHRLTNSRIINNSLIIHPNSKNSNRHNNISNSINSKGKNNSSTTMTIIMMMNTMEKRTTMIILMGITMIDRQAINSLTNSNRRKNQGLARY